MVRIKKPAADSLPPDFTVFCSVARQHSQIQNGHFGERLVGPGLQHRGGVREPSRRSARLHQNHLQQGESSRKTSGAQQDARLPEAEEKSECHVIGSVLSRSGDNNDRQQQCEGLRAAAGIYALARDSPMQMPVFLSSTLLLLMKYAQKPKHQCQLYMHVYNHFDTCVFTAVKLVRVTREVFEWQLIPYHVVDLSSTQSRYPVLCSSVTFLC